MASISAGPKFLGTFLESIEDDTKKVLPGEDPPTMMETLSNALVEVNKAAADAVMVSQSPAEATLTIKIKVKVAPSNGRGAFPTSDKVEHETKIPKHPVVKVDCHIDGEGNLVEKEMRQKKLRGIDDEQPPKGNDKTKIN